DLTDLANGDVLVWDEIEEKWLPGAGGGGEPVQMRVDSGWIEYSNDAGDTWDQLVELSTLQGPPGADGEEGPQGPPGPSSSCFPTASFDGGTGDIAVNAFCDLFVPFGFEITRATLVADAAGMLQVDVRVSSYASFPPVALDSICG